MHAVSSAPCEEVPLDLLSARYEDSEEEKVQPRAARGAAPAPQAAGGRAGAPAAAAPTAAEEAAAEDAEEEEWSEEEEEEEEEWSDDEELATALEWADLREDQQARGNAGAASGSGAALAAFRPNAHGGALNRPRAPPLPAAAAASGRLAPTANNMGRLDSHFHAGSVRLRGDDLADALGHAGGARMANAVVNQVRAGARAGGGGGKGGQVKDRSDRATVEQVLDPRTRMVLFKMLNRGMFSEINGCVSTGKEANVYHASGAGGQELAIKVYKTAILVFRDRDRWAWEHMTAAVGGVVGVLVSRDRERYVVGDSRFQRYCKSNPRKMVKLWAEKEMRNLSRLHAAGINCPRPLLLRLHVLVMEFLGEGGVAAPRLKDAGLPPARLHQAYTEMVVMVRALYQRCRLVHADLSEYNVLVHNNELYCIDVSQAVELDHPRAFDFLREDCQHVNDYFRRQGVATLTVRELFDFVVDPAITEDNLDAALDRLMEVAASRPISLTAEQEVEEAVFKQASLWQLHAFIPKKLEEVAHYERDHARLQAGGAGAEGIYYQAIAGMKTDMSGARVVPQALEEPASAASAAVAEPTQRQQHQQQQSQQQQSQQALSQPALSEAAEAAASASWQQPAEGTRTSQSAAEAGGTSDSLPAGGRRVRFAAGTRDGAASGSEEDASGSDSESNSSGSWEERPKLSKDEQRAVRKEHKKEVKAANKERRQDKTPKHVKKRAAKAGKKKR
eukprot:scaffold1.g5225.t1